MSAPPPRPYRAPPSAPRRAAVPAAPARPKPLVRAQAPEEPNPARPPQLTLPSPEQLGVAVRPIDNVPVAASRSDTERTRSASAPPPADWTALHARMKALGVVSFHVDWLTDGRARFICWVPSGRPGLTRRIESVAATEAEAVQRGLQRAAQLKSSPPR